MKQTLTTMIQAARKRQGAHYLCGFIDAYCDNPACTARKIEVMIKTYGADDPVSVRCPLCGTATLINRVKNLRERVTERRTLSVSLSEAG